MTIWIGCEPICFEVGVQYCNSRFDNWCHPLIYRWVSPSGLKGESVKYIEGRTKQDARKNLSRLLKWWNRQEWKYYSVPQ